MPSCPTRASTGVAVEKLTGDDAADSPSSVDSGANPSLDPKLQPRPINMINKRRYRTLISDFEVIDTTS